MDTTFDVRVYKTDVYRGTRVTSYTVRWKTAHKSWKRSFRNAAQADVFRSELLTSARKGEAFSLAIGEPVTWQRAKHDMTWYSFACAYVDMKWKTAAAKYRRNIAQALAAASPPMLLVSPEQPSDQHLRSALVNWGFNSGRRSSAPEEVADVLVWIEGHSRKVSELAEPALCRQVLSAATSKLDGSRAAASSVKRNRTVLLNALDYAVELQLLDDNPGRKLKWRNPAATWEVDKRSVINPTQARALLDAVREQQPSGPRLVAFFGVLYYSGLRPEEAIGLRRQDVTLPDPVWDKSALSRGEAAGAWGEFHLRAAKPDVGRQWTDDGSSRDSRGLKQRAEGETRRVPCPPPLVKLMRDHFAEVGGEPGQPTFRGVQGGPLPTITYRRSWDRARKAVFSPEDYSSPLARRPYDLRHACLSTWLNGGVAPAQVAAWAGHSVEVLLRVYSKCLEGQDDVARRRISEALAMGD